MDWTQELEIEAEALYMQGLSMSQIAGKLGNGLTRSAISGKINRKGWVRIVKKETPEKLSSYSKPRRKRKPYQSPVAIPAPVSYKPRRERVKINAEGALVSCDIFHLNGNTCRWPLWGNTTKIEEMLYCGDAIEQGSSYCTGHRRKSGSSGRSPWGERTTTARQGVNHPYP